MIFQKLFGEKKKYEKSLVKVHNGYSRCFCPKLTTRAVPLVGQVRCKNHREESLNKKILRGKLSNKGVAQVFVNSNGETSLLRLTSLLIVLVASSCHSYFRSRVSLLIFSINEPFPNKYLKI